MFTILLQSRAARLAAAVTSLVLLTIFGPVTVGLTKRDVEWNQFLIQRAELNFGAASTGDLYDFAKSSWLLGIQRMFESRPPKPALDDTKAMFRYIFSNVPPYAVVYPTEGFYYFSTDVDGKRVMGNLRVAELSDKKLSFTYFTVGDKQTWSYKLSESDQFHVTKKADGLFEVSTLGMNKTFQITDRWKTPPRRLKLLAEERFVGQINDESGIRLFLLFNENTSSFYEVLNEESAVCERLIPADGRHFVGARTGFVYYEDPDYKRKILVGVDLENVKANNFFDGPGDQVPFFLNLRDLLHRAYPNTLLGDGIDEHGVYLHKEDWMRVAVCPYFRYVRIDEVLARSAKCDINKPKGQFWTDLTKEWWNTETWRDGVMRKIESEKANVK